MSASFFHPQHTTRRMRLVELVWSDPALFMGVVVPQNYTVMAAPQHRTMPKLAIVGDSMQQTCLAYGGSAMGASISQALGLWERCIISAIGGRGFITGGPSNTPISHPNQIADLIAYDADVYTFIGSQNDPPNATTTTAVTSVIDQLLTARPNAYVVGIGPVVGINGSLAAAVKNGYAAAKRQDRVRFIDNQADPWMPTGQIADWTVDADQNHLSQDGMDRFATIAAPQIANAIQDMVGV